MAEFLEAAISITMASSFRGRKELHFHSFAVTQPPAVQFFLSPTNSRTQNVKSRKLVSRCLSKSCITRATVGNRTPFPEKTSENEEALSGNRNGNLGDKISRKRRVFLLDVNHLCYKGSTPSLESFAHWISLFFSQVSLNDPVIVVVRLKGTKQTNVVATLVEEVLKMGYQVAIASPDKDFEQLISEDVQIVLPVLEFDRWSFYTIKHYVAQHYCDPV